MIRTEVLVFLSPTERRTALEFSVMSEGTALRGNICFHMMHNQLFAEKQRYTQEVCES